MRRAYSTNARPSVKAPVARRSSQSPIRIISKDAGIDFDRGSFLIQIVALPVDEALAD